MSELAELFHNNLFISSEIAHGTHGEERVVAGTRKIEIKGSAFTRREPATAALWAEHLKGTRALGLIPITVNHTCRWAAIDLDVYDDEEIYRRTVAKLAEGNLPGHPCRSKSGGVHVYFFFSEPIPASTVIRKMRMVANYLGCRSDVEIFPKQESINAAAGDAGNWINLPYFQGDKTNRYAIKPDGRSGYSAEAFYERAYASRLSLAQLEAINLEPTTDSITSPKEPVFADGPPCIQKLASIGVGEGSRNNGLFAFGVLARKFTDDGWEALLSSWNSKYFTPALSADEVTAVVRSLKKKSYSYKCKDAPIVSHCDVVLCRKRAYGVGMRGGAPIIDTISFLDTEPPLFFVMLKSQTRAIECSAADLLEPRFFQKLAMAQLQVVLPMFKVDEWLAQLRDSVETATRIEAPKEVGVTGRFESLLEGFCTDRYVGETPADMLLGKPYKDSRDSRVWFRFQDLEQHLETARFKELSKPQIVERIKKLDGRSKFHNLKGKGVNAWGIPADKFQWQTEAHDRPKMVDAGVI